MKVSRFAPRTCNSDEEGCARGMRLEVGVSSIAGCVERAEIVGLVGRLESVESDLQYLLALDLTAVKKVGHTSAAVVVTLSAVEFDSLVGRLSSLI